MLSLASRAYLCRVEPDFLHRLGWERNGPPSFSTLRELLGRWLENFEYFTPHVSPGSWQNCLWGAVAGVLGRSPIDIQNGYLTYHCEARQGAAFWIKMACI